MPELPEVESVVRALKPHVEGRRILTAELRQNVWQALARLTADQRAAVVMKYYLEMSEAERVAVNRRIALLANKVTGS